MSERQANRYSLVFATGVTMIIVLVGIARLPAGGAEVDTVSTPVVAQDALYTAELQRVVDGDTYDLKIRVWEDIVLEKRIRLLGVDTPELHPRGGTPEEKLEEKARAQAATDFVRGVLESAKILRFQYGWKSDSFGRALGTVIADGKDIRDLLREAGHLKTED